jgi:hypothetical protein
VIGVIFLAPVVAAVLLWSPYRQVGAWLLLTSMAGSFVLDFACHFVIPGPDNVFTLRQGAWLVPFWVSSVILVVVTGLGSLIGGWTVVRLSRFQAARPSDPNDPGVLSEGDTIIRDEPSLAPEARFCERHRPLLFSVAYRMVGSAIDAEDTVQEAYLRWRGTHEKIRSNLRRDAR